MNSNQSLRKSERYYEFTNNGMSFTVLPDLFLQSKSGKQYFVYGTAVTDYYMTKDEIYTHLTQTMKIARRDISMNLENKKCYIL